MKRPCRMLPGLLLTAMLAGGCAAKSGVAFSALHYPMATQQLAVGTASIAVHDSGAPANAPADARTLVLVHGLGSSMPAWSENLAALSARHRVVAIDLPGYGKSSKGNYDYSMAFFAKAVRGVVRELGLSHVVLVGHSMGGQIAMTYALEYPQDVDALVLSSPAGLERFADGEAHWLASATTPEFTCKADAEAVWLRHMQNFHRAPKSAEFMVRDRLAVVGGPDFEAYCNAVSRSVAGMLDGPVADRLRDLELPTLVLFGEYDNLIPNPFLHGGSTERLAKKAVDTMRDGQLVMLERAGHFAQYEAADAWNSAVLRFLDDVHAPKGERTRRLRPAAPGASVEPLYAPGTDPDARAPATEPPAIAPSEPTPPAEPEPEPEPTPAEPPATTTPPEQPVAARGARRSRTTPEASP
ncbi:MAG: alpha/beta fold hydrolase [Nannocystaceae bacterium]|nr:alpha/beta fold hydrolase [Nannocystaceae bacterium]